MKLAETWKRHATRWGLISGCAALVLWPAYAIVQEPLRLPFLAALMLTASAGLSLLAITASDMLTVRRSRHARPARAFDLALGALMLLPSGAAAIELFS